MASSADHRGGLKSMELVPPAAVAATGAAGGRHSRSSSAEKVKRLTIIGGQSGN